MTEAERIALEFADRHFLKHCGIHVDEEPQLPTKDYTHANILNPGPNISEKPSLTPETWHGTRLGLLIVLAFWGLIGIAWYVWRHVQ